MKDQVDFILKLDNNVIKMKLNRDDYLLEILKQIFIKENKNIEEYIFIYEDNKLIINEKMKLEELKKDCIKILAIPKNENIDKKDKKKVKKHNIICPKCKRHTMINIDDYKITLSKCDNGHFFPNILLNKFYSTQKIDINLSSKNINNNENDELINKPKISNEISQDSAPTPLSASKSFSKEIKKVNSDNNIININNNINYNPDTSTKCLTHIEKYSSYCLECKKNLCSECEMNHNKNNKVIHKIIHFYEILSNNVEYINKLKKDLNNFRLKLDTLKIELNKLTNIINNVIDNYEVYYKIYNDLVSNYDIETRNYHILKNITNIKLDEVFKDIDKLNNEGHFFKKFENVFEIYNKMNCQNDIIIKYLPENANKIKIFGTKFVINNKNKCKIIFNNHLYDIYDTYVINNDLKSYINSQNGILEIKLRINKNENLTNLSHMFKDCSTLLFLPNISELNTFHVTDMSYLFYGCSLLENLPNISKWNTSNVTNMSYMFFHCSSLISLPDISKWNISNVTDISHLFSNCISLSSIPDISKWNINSVTNMSYLFYYCTGLKSLPDISKWDIKNVNNISYMFSCCSSLTKVPDISVWNTSQVRDVSYLFFGCKSLTSLPDISKWNSSNISNMGFMFEDINPNIKVPRLNPNECCII